MTSRLPASWPVLAIVVLACMAAFARGQCIDYEDQKIVDPDVGAWGGFGKAIALSEDVLLVGKPYDDAMGRAGSAFVFRFDGAQWLEEQKLFPSDGGTYEFFGESVAVCGDTLMVGKKNDSDATDTYFGSVYVFRNDGVGWVEKQKLTASDRSDYRFFGVSLWMNHGVAVIGSTGYITPDAGSAYIFRFDGVKWIEEQKLTSLDGAIGDGFGYSVGLDGDLALIGAPNDDDNGDLSGSAYVFRYDGSRWLEEQKLTASDAAMDDIFGRSASVSGNVVAVGAPRYVDGNLSDDSGGVYVFRFDGATWMEEQKLPVSESDAEDFFGYCVQLQDNLLVVGAPGESDAYDAGSAYCFRYAGNQWQLDLKLLASDGGRGDFGDELGASLATDGLQVLLSAAGNSLGAVYRYSLSSLTLRSGYAWLNSGDLLDLDTCDGLPGAPVLLAVVGLNGSAYFSPLSLGAFDADGHHSFSTTLPDGIEGIDLSFQSFGFVDQSVDRSNEVGVGFPFNEDEKLLPSDGATGDHFAEALAVSGDVAVIGSPNDRYFVGSAYVFRSNGTAWLQEQHLLVGDPKHADRFGASVAIDGDVAVIGEPGDDGPIGSNVGAAFVFRYDGTAWLQQQELAASDASSEDQFGRSVAIQGDLLLVGASGAGSQSQGAVYVFRFDGTRWNEEQRLTSSDGASIDNFGSVVVMHGSTAAVGARYHSSVYVFEYDGVSWIETQELDAGSSLSLSGDVLVAGSQVFRHDGVRFTEEQQLSIDDGYPHDYFGAAVSVNGDLILVGDLSFDGSRSWGAAHLFRYDGAAWKHFKKLVSSDNANNDYFGYAVVLGNDQCLIGAPYDDDLGSSSGAAYVFKELSR